MKSIIFQLLVVLALLPMSLQADTKSDIKLDMANPALTLEQIVQKALDGGMEIEDIMTEMIAIAPEQSSAIISTGFVMVPGKYDEIIQVAIAAGIAADEVVVMALVATGDDVQDQVVAAVKKAAPGKEIDIDKAVAKMPDRDTTTDGSGGGGVSDTVQIILDILTDLDDGIGSPAGGQPT